jgi:hypothetical protein
METDSGSDKSEKNGEMKIEHGNVEIEMVK